MVLQVNLKTSAIYTMVYLNYWVQMVFSKENQQFGL